MNQYYSYTKADGVSTMFPGALDPSLHSGLPVEMINKYLPVIRPRYPAAPQNSA